MGWFVQKIMNINNITVACYTSKKIKFEKPSELIEILIAKLNIIITTICERLNVTGVKFTKIMVKLSILKLAMAMITLVVMTVLLFTHLDAFEPITAQFSKWISSPIICFILLVIVAKFVGLGIGLTLTIMSIKGVTFAGLKIELSKQFKQRYRFSYKRKALTQKV
jgi:hypothetical protein